MSIRILIPYLLFFWLTACTNYQYVHLSSDLPKTTDSEHYYLSDSLVYVDFDFNGNHFPVKIYFLNESEIPVFFDLSETLFFENQSYIQSAYGMMGNDLEEQILIPAGKGASFQFRPFRSEPLPVLKAQSDYIEVGNADRKEFVRGMQMKEWGRNFEIFITYRVGEETGRKTTLKAEFKEDYIYFTTSQPVGFSSGTSPYCYYVSQSSEGGQLAASLLVEVASASLYYIWLESLD